MVFIFFIILFVSITLLRLKIEIKNLKFKLDRNFLNDDFAINFTIFLLNYIPVFKIKITKEKLQKINIKSKIKYRVKSYNNKINLDLLKILIPQIKKMDLKIKIGTENAAYTAYLYSFIKLITVNLFKRDILVEAIFNNKNELNIFLEGIFELKMIHIISKLIIYNKRRGYKNERTSNRRTYAFGNE